MISWLKFPQVCSFRKVQNDAAGVMWTRGRALMHRPLTVLPPSTGGVDIDYMNSDWTRVTVHLHFSTNPAADAVWLVPLQFVAPDQQRHTEVEQTYVRLPPALWSLHSCYSCSPTLVPFSSYQPRLTYFCYHARTYPIHEEFLNLGVTWCAGVVTGDMFGFWFRSYNSVPPVYHTHIHLNGHTVWKKVEKHCTHMQWNFLVLGFYPLHVMGKQLCRLLLVYTLIPSMRCLQCL